MSISLLIRQTNNIKLWIFKVNPTITIQEIKEQIEKKLHIPIDKQLLSLKTNNNLLNEKKISEYNYNNSEKIYMHLTIG